MKEVGGFKVYRVTSPSGEVPKAEGAALAVFLGCVGYTDNGIVLHHPLSASAAPIGATHHLSPDGGTETLYDFTANNQLIFNRGAL